MNSTLLILLLVANASASSRYDTQQHSTCIKGCNDAPFKIAIKQRRAACVKKCVNKPKNIVNADTIDALRDPECVSNCAKRTLARKRNACIDRCPMSKSVIEISDQGFGIELNINDTRTIKSDDNFTTALMNKYLDIETPDSFSAQESNDGTNDKAANVQSATFESIISVHDLNVVTVNSTAKVLTSCAPQNDTHPIENELTPASDDTKSVDELKSLPNGTKPTPAKEVVNVTTRDTAVTSTDENVLLVQNEPRSKNVTEVSSKQAVATSVEDQNRTAIIKNDDTNSNGIIIIKKHASVPSAFPLTPNPEAQENDVKYPAVVYDIHSDYMTHYSECTQRCTTKRTLKRKRDSCLERCNSLKKEGPSINTLTTADVVMKFRGSAKFEL